MIRILISLLGIVVLTLGVYFITRPSEPPKVTYVLPEPNPDRVKILEQIENPPKQPYHPKIESTEVTSKTSQEVETKTVTDDSILPYDDEELETFLELVEQNEEAERAVSPFGFGEFPEVPTDFPESVIWQSDMQSEIEKYGSERIKAVELMGRVLVKLWKQGHQATSAHTADNGMIYPSYPYTVYLDFEYKTDSDGNRYVSGGRLSGYDGITESEIDAIMEGNIPPGITVLSYSNDGIDPYSFLNLN